MKRVLLTGARGFIGRHCLPLLLEQNYEVHAVYSGSSLESVPGVRWHRADLLDGGRIRELMAEVRPTHLLHLAWYTVPGKYWTSMENTTWLGASLNLFEAFSLSGGARVVVAGTCAEYDWESECCHEALTPLKPATLYGVSKHCLRLMTEALAGRLNFSAAWGRIFFLYGPHEHPARLVPSVICGLLRKERVQCSAGTQVRDFLYVKDVASAFVALLGRDVRGPVNIASGQPVAIKEVINRIADKLGGHDLIEFGALPAQGEPARLVADIGRLSKEVGWSPQYSLDQGLNQTIQWWRNNF
jgi:nucleoside-diphosphate-sugar epimerase